jgi:hypothetical protein
MGKTKKEEQKPKYGRGKPPPPKGSTVTATKGITKPKNPPPVPRYKDKLIIYTTQPLRDIGIDLNKCASPEFLQEVFNSDVVTKAREGSRKFNAFMNKLIDQGKVGHVARWQRIAQVASNTHHLSSHITPILDGLYFTLVFNIIRDALSFCKLTYQPRKKIRDIDLDLFFSLILPMKYEPKKFIPNEDILKRVSVIAKKNISHATHAIKSDEEIKEEVIVEAMIQTQDE